MSALDAALAALLVLLCAHVGLLLVLLVRSALPQRRSSERTLGLASGGAALLGELVALQGLIAPPVPFLPTAGLLGVALLLGLYGRAAWREGPAGRLAFHAVVAGPLVVLFVLVLSFR